jgi:hypothetical protein
MKIMRSTYPMGQPFAAGLGIGADEKTLVK